MSKNIKKNCNELEHPKLVVIIRVPGCPPLILNQGARVPHLGGHPAAPLNPSTVSKCVSAVNPHVQKNADREGHMYTAMHTW